MFDDGLDSKVKPTARRHGPNPGTGNEIYAGDVFCFVFAFSCRALIFDPFINSNAIFYWFFLCVKGDGGVEAQLYGFLV